MGIMGIAIPNDIRWQRICHTEDMADPTPCDAALPPKWQSSIAVFRYVPDAEYQVAPGRRISYLKVTCTISSYQPKADEVGIAITGSALSVGEEQELQRKLKSYHPCHGAILQVSVTPHEAAALADYPYIADVQPKQRALYEQVTDTGEISSRSLETLNVRKGAGTTESQEVLDIDKGFSASGNAEVNTPYGGGGGGLGVSQSFERGTKNIGQADRTRIETTDSTRESREVHSHTTQLTQMYTLLQAYHVGTNRVMFYVSPRPHMLEEPSGFIRGPRVIDGIQDFFLIVDQPDTQELPCVSVRLDTAHLTRVDVFDYDRSQASRLLSVNVAANPPGERDTDRVGAPSDPFYDCVISPPITDVDTVPAPAGYVVDDTLEIGVTETHRGSTTLDISADRRTATLTATATGHVCYRNDFGDASNVVAVTNIASSIAGPLGTLGGLIAVATGADAIPEERSRDAGYARRRVEVRFRSEVPTKKIGERETLLVTSRMLCCCEPAKTVPPKLVAVVPLNIPAYIGLNVGVPELEKEAKPGPLDPGPRKSAPNSLSAREANDLQEKIADTLSRSVAEIANVETQRGLDADYALTRVTEFALGVPRLRRSLTKPADELPGIDASAMRKLREAGLPFSPSGEKPSRLALISTSPAALARLLGKDSAVALKAQVHAFGLGQPTRKGESESPKPPASDQSTKGASRRPRR